jgi:hypothetical protein
MVGILFDGRGNSRLVVHYVFRQVATWPLRFFVRMKQRSQRLDLGEVVIELHVIPVLLPRHFVPGNPEWGKLHFAPGQVGLGASLFPFRAPHLEFASGDRDHLKLHRRARNRHRVGDHETLLGLHVRLL